MLEASLPPRMVSNAQIMLPHASSCHLSRFYLELTEMDIEDSKPRQQAERHARDGTDNFQILTRMLTKTVMLLNLETP
jgi:hypothetical protein